MFGKHALVTWIFVLKKGFWFILQGVTGSDDDDDDGLSTRVLLY